MAVSDSNAELLAQLRLEQTRLKQGLIARNTIVGYTYDVKMYEAWCEHLGLNAFPGTTETLSLYLTDLLSQGKKITTARRRKCAIVHEHRARGLPSPATSEVTELLLGAQRLRAERPRQMRPITVRELAKISATLARIGSPAALRNRALFVIGFASGLRRSNLAALNFGDVEFCRRGLVLSIAREKQDRKGQGRLVGICRGKRSNTDPVGVLRAWLRVRGRIFDQGGPLFPRLNPAHRGEPMDGGSIYRIVKTSLALVGIDETQRGPHSLRSGLVTAAGQANIGVLQIGAHTGQSPEMVRRYFRESEIWVNNPSGKLGL
jgi:site-specific recombinase XerD